MNKQRTAAVRKRGMSRTLPLVLSFAGILAACADSPPPAEARREDPSRDAAVQPASAVAQDSASGLLEARVPRAVAGDSGWRYQQRVSADLDGDGTQEIAVLISDVGLDDRGRPLWEDGHRWQVYVEEPDDVLTYLYARFLPNGKLTAMLTDSDSGTAPTIVLLEQMPYAIGVYEFGYRGPGQIVVLSRFQRALESVRTFLGAPSP